MTPPQELLGFRIQVARQQDASRPVIEAEDDGVPVPRDALGFQDPDPTRPAPLRSGSGRPRLPSREW